MITDLSMSLPVAEAAQYHSEVARSKPTFLYELTHRPSFTFGEEYAPDGFKGPNFGVSFSDDLFFLFHELNYVNALQTEADRKTSETMVKFWTNFAKYGAPSPFR